MGGNGALVYTVEGLPGDFEIAIGRGGGPNLVGRPDVAGAGEYPIIYTVHDSDENRMVEDSDVMLFVLVIFAIPPAGPPPGVLRNCPYLREADEANFNILVQFEGHFDPWLQDEVNCAAAYWENAITADIGAPVSPRGYVGGCSPYGDRYTGRDVDDLMIVVHFESQRAPATAWACEEREGVGLPAARIAFAASVTTCRGSQRIRTSTWCRVSWMRTSTSSSTWRGMKSATRSGSGLPRRSPAMCRLERSRARTP